MKRVSVAQHIAVCVAVALAFSACGTAVAAIYSGAKKVTANSSANSSLSSASVNFAAKFTGAKKGKANSKLAPVTVGFVNEESGLPSFPEVKAGAVAAVKLINEKLDGVDGHPLTLETCPLPTEEAGLKCAAQLRSAKVPIAVLGSGLGGDASFYKAVDAKFPIIVTIAGTPADFSSPDAYALEGGGAAVLNGMVSDAVKLAKGKTVANISSTSPAADHSAEAVIEPELTKLKANFTKTVFYPEPVTTPQMVSALESARASSAGAILADFASSAQCLEAYDAAKELDITVPMVVSNICASPSFVETIDKSSGGPAGWYMWSNGPSPYVKNAESEMYIQAMNAYGQSHYTYQGFANQGFGNLLDVDHYANALGPNKLTPAGYVKEIKAFRGPASMGAGKLTCGSPPFATEPTICGKAAAGALFKAHEWFALPEALR